MTPTVSDALLNAFVDGELAPADAAHVAEALARDPGLARRAARLHRMKAALGGYGDHLPLPELPQVELTRPELTRPEPPQSAPAWPWRVRRRVGAAAAMAALAALGLASFSAPLGPQQDMAQDEHAALAQHDRWVQDSAHPLGLALPDGFDWMTPVMQASGLQLMQVHSARGETHFGFKGPNACRLSLFVTPATGSSPLRLTLAADIQHAQWQVGGLAFEMMARDMALARFATVATGLHQGSHALGGDDALRMALIQSARLPCMA